MALDLHVAPLGFGSLEFSLGFRQSIVESDHLIIRVRILKFLDSCRLNN